MLLQYPKLKILYLHGNQIDKLSEVDKLGALPELFSITLHGNPIEDIPGYKQYVISALPQLKVFNTITITNQDRSDASTWKRKFRKKWVSQQYNILKLPLNWLSVLTDTVQLSTIHHFYAAPRAIIIVYFINCQIEQKQFHHHHLLC